MSLINANGSVQNGETSNDKHLFPVYTAMDVNDNLVFAGFSSLTGDYWYGGVSVFKLNSLMFPTNTFVEKSTDVVNICDHLLTHITFDSSVASVVTLTLDSTVKRKNAALIGLDDGSIQLVGLADSENDNRSQENSVSTNSATYHDSPLSKVLIMSNKSKNVTNFLSMDVEGLVKYWDLENLSPIKSWSINSYNWPVNGNPICPDIINLPSSCSTTTTSSPVNNVDSYLIATLNPTDLFRQLCVWDLRTNSLLQPTVNYCHLFEDLSSDTDLPISIGAHSSTQLLVGTYKGNLLSFDIRYPNHALNKLSVFSKGDSSASELQVTQILSQNAEPTTNQYIAALGHYGRVSVFESEHLITKSSDPKPIYQFNEYQSLFVNKSVGQFLNSSTSTNQIKAPTTNDEKRADWQLLTTLGSLIKSDCDTADHQFCLHSYWSDGKYSTKYWQSYYDGIDWQS